MRQAGCCGGADAERITPSSFYLVQNKSAICLPIPVVGAGTYKKGCCITLQQPFFLFPMQSPPLLLCSAKIPNFPIVSSSASHPRCRRYPGSGRGSGLPGHPDRSQINYFLLRRFLVSSTISPSRERNFFTKAYSIFLYPETKLFSIFYNRKPHRPQFSGKYPPRCLPLSGRLPSHQIPGRSRLR